MIITIENNPKKIATKNFEIYLYEVNQVHSVLYLKSFKQPFLGGLSSETISYLGLATLSKMS